MIPKSQHFPCVINQTCTWPANHNSCGGLHTLHWAGFAPAPSTCRWNATNSRSAAQTAAARMRHVLMDSLQELNERHRGEMYILTSAKDHTHFMDAESTVQMWEGPLQDAFSKRRLQLGLARGEHRGALVYDAFTANESTSGGTTMRRNMRNTQRCSTRCLALRHF